MTSELYRIPITRIDGKQATLAEYHGSVLLIVNVASACGLTWQYAGLESLYERYNARGFAVLGFPCNDFGGQEPGFGPKNYSDVLWNFEKFVVDRHGRVIGRFAPDTPPHDPVILAAIEAGLGLCPL